MSKAIAIQEWDNDKVGLLKRTILKTKGGNLPTDDELQLFLGVCKRTGLDPFTRQIYSIERWNSDTNRYDRAVQVSIDGFRVLAERSGEYAGQDGPYWCGEDGVWKDVWLSKKAPAASKITVFKKGQDKGFTGVATYEEYVQKKKDGTPVKMWQTMPSNQLAKCAESLALRKAFPNDMSGLYTVEEYPLDDTGTTAAPRSERPVLTAAASVSGGHQASEVTTTDFAEADSFRESSLEDYEVKSGSLLGVKFRDRPDTFWRQYKGELEKKLSSLPTEYRQGASELLFKIQQHLDEKQM
jgi:phage recombination protein Bet